MKRCARCGQVKSVADFGRRMAAPDGLHPWCKECVREYCRAKYAEHPEQIKAAVHEYRDRNRAAVRARDRERYQQSKGAYAERRKRYYDAHRESVLAKSAEWHKENRDKCRGAEARYREANREKRREAGRRLYRETPVEQLRAKAVRNAHLRRARKRQSSIVPFTPQQLKDKMAYWGNVCWMCGGPMQEIDHVKPLAKGGPHVLANLRPACHTCNDQKSNKWPVSTLGHQGVRT